jgi:phenylalanyl-tRNA synthetase alpha chain
LPLDGEGLHNKWQRLLSLHLMELMMSLLDETLNTFASELQALTSLEQVREKRRDLQVWVSQQFQGLSSLEPAEKRRIGQELNRLKTEIERLVAARLHELEAVKPQAGEAFDLELPGPPLRLGRAHPTVVILRRMNSFFQSLGFEVVDGPEIETDRYNYGALNIPADHPAREMQDTIYVLEPDVLLRSHTSAVETRIMEGQKPPIRIVAPGKAYRNEAINATNNYMFFQYEGLAIDRHIKMSHLHWILAEFLKFMFGADCKSRFRAKYYPQVEPGLGVDLACEFCGGSGCSTCKQKGWIEILGAGMVHPNVLNLMGIDWSQYSGFAFGMGLDRLVMTATGITDIRELYGPRMSYIPEV